MNLAITIAGRINEKTYEHEVLPQFEYVRNLASPGSLITVDLSAFRFSGPSFPAVLLMLMGHLSEDCGARLLLIPPELDHAIAYLHRIDFFTYAQFVADFDTRFLSNARKYKEAKHSRTILEINRITEESNTKSIINNLLIRGHNILAANLYYSHSKIDQFLKIVAELCLNITDHSESWGVVLIQYLSYLRPPMVRISVVDKGIGIRGSLAKKYAQYEGKKDDDCIKAVLQKGMTRKQGRLLGLYAIRVFANEWRGVMKIRSGTAKVEISRSNKEKQVSGLVFFPGTHVDVRLPASDGQQEKP